MQKHDECQTDHQSDHVDDSSCRRWRRHHVTISSSHCLAVIRAYTADYANIIIYTAVFRDKKVSLSVTEIRISFFAKNNDR